MSTFFLAHGVQCAAAELHATSAPTGMSMGPVDHAAQGHTAAALTPVPPHPHDEGTHALLVCFAVLAGAAALLLGARSLWPAVVRSVADHLRSRARLVPTVAAQRSLGRRPLRVANLIGAPAYRPTSID